MKLSASLIKTYKMCRRKYELRYIEELEPVEKAKSLQDGTDYHAMIEGFYKGDGIGYEEGKDPKICAMAWAYAVYLWQKHEELKDVQYVEKWFSSPISSKHTIIGRNDAIAKDGLPIEHKTTSSDVDEEYIYTLQWDEQILTYMLANGINEMYYTVIKKPTIRQKKGETDAEFFERCYEWYSIDTDKKARLIKVTRSMKEIHEFGKSLVLLGNEIESCKNFYRNPTACNCYNRRCEYSSVCLDYNPQLKYVEFEKKQRYAKEVEEDGIF